MTVNEVPSRKRRWTIYTSCLSLRFLLGSTPRYPVLTLFIFNLAYVSEIYVAEEFDESEFLLIMIEALAGFFDELVDAIYIDPSPVTVIAPNPHGLSFFWDRSKGRKINIVESLKKSGFKKVGKGPYLLRLTHTY